LFRHPESIDDKQMVRLPLQKLLEQIGKLRRLDHENPLRALPPAPMVEPSPQTLAPLIPEPVSRNVERKPLPSWLEAEVPSPANGHAHVPAVPSPMEKSEEAVLQPFEVPIADRAEAIAAEIIEIIPARTEPVSPAADEPVAPLLLDRPDPVVDARSDNFEVPTYGEAPVVELTQSDNAVLDVVPFEEPLADSWLGSMARIELPPAAKIPVVDQPAGLKTPVLEAVWVRAPRTVAPEPVVQAPVEPAVAADAGIDETPASPVSSLALAETLPPAIVPKSGEPKAAAEPVSADPTLPAESRPSPSPSVESKVPAAPFRTPPAPFASPRIAPNPVTPKFPLRPPRSFSKPVAPVEPAARPKPTPPPSPVFSGRPPQAAPKPFSQPKARLPRLFGANPLDRYFSTKAAPPVNWCAAGALLGVKGEVTASRIADAISALPGIFACLIVAPPYLSVSGKWPEPTGVDSSLAFVRRLSGVLKQRDGPTVAHRQIQTDSGSILVFAIDDILLCAAARIGEVAPTIRQKLLVVTKAMAHARQVGRNRPDL
jgi:hypothetical protein